MNFAGVEKIAAAILYEGYILYPYRPTAIKNRQRWNFGTLYPRVYAEAQKPQEAFRLVAECVVAADETADLDLKLSFLQLVQQTLADESAELTDPSLAWDQAIERTAEWAKLPFADLIASPRSLIVQQQSLQIELLVGAEIIPEGACKLHVEVRNVTPLELGSEKLVPGRDDALRLSFVSAHVLLAVDGGSFVSLLDPEPRFRQAAEDCHNLGVFPVLAGEEPDRSMMLCSPIILYDYPKIAPESEGDFFDGTEMDEMLTLRVLTLTETEKQEMRNGDPRARRILERTEALTPDAMLKAHGVIRELRDLRGGAS